MPIKQNISSNSKSAHYAYFLCIFVAFFYLVTGFQFGIANNEEELPLIYGLAGFADFSKDVFVTTHTQGYNVLYPYIYPLASLGKWLGFENMKGLFFIIHFITLCCLYLSIRLIIKQIYKNTSEWWILFAMVFLLFGERLLIWMPNTRGFFFAYLDPEFVTLPLAFFSIAYFVKGDAMKAALFLFLTNLAHPLYAIPLLFIYMIVLLFYLFLNSQSLRQIASQAMMFCVAVLPYALYIWWSHRQTLPDYNAAQMHEAMLPEHLEIPSIRSHNRQPYMRFFEMVGFFFIVGMLLYSHNTYIIKLKYLYQKISNSTSNFTPKSARTLTPYRSASLVIAAFILFFLGVSAITSIHKIDAIVQLTPYRMGIVLISLAWAFFIACVAKFKDENGFAIPPVWKWAFFAAFFLAMTGAGMWRTKSLNNGQFAAFMPSEAKREMANWIVKNTPEDALFLNYAYMLDVRTNCLRASYFSQKTIPMRGDAQVEWYKQMRAFYNVPQEIGEFDYKGVMDYIFMKNGRDSVRIEGALEQINVKIDYVLVPEGEQFKFEIGTNLKKVFSNEKFALYKVE